MAQYKDIVLSSIGKVRVYRPPNMKIHRMVSGKYKYPPQPTKTVEMYRGKNEPKEKEVILIVEGPEFDAWKSECDAIDVARFDEINNYNYLFAFQDVEVPEDFDIKKIERFAKMIDESWRPRHGPNGRILDYLEWVVLGLSDDAVKTSDTIDELQGISQEVVDDVKDSFPG